MTTIAIDIELAWAAGLFDGEGSIFATKRFKPGTKVCYAPLTMAVVMTDHDSVKRFKNAVGIGRVEILKRKTVGGKTVYRWSISSESDVRYAFAKIEPFLGSAKVVQAYKAFDTRNKAVAKLTYGRK